MRRRYETADDLRIEADTLKIFCLNMNCTYKKVKELENDYSPDATFWRNGQRVAVGEVKARNNIRDMYSHYMISKNKIDSIYERWLPVPFILIVRWYDGIYWVAITEPARLSWTVAHGGRRDRGDPKDQEDLYYIPIQEFTRLKMDGISQ